MGESLVSDGKFQAFTCILLPFFDHYSTIPRLAFDAKGVKRTNTKKEW